LASCETDSLLERACLGMVRFRHCQPLCSTSTSTSITPRHSH
jgi:hypothetical protein